MCRLRIRLLTSMRSRTRISGSFIIQRSTWRPRISGKRRQKAGIFQKTCRRLWRSISERQACICQNSLPDIPVFTGMILKNIYETALQYGYSYESREEKYFILLLIRGAVSYGDTLCEIDGKVNEFIRNGILPEEYQDKEQIEQTAGALSKELLYMKFLQGIPVVGAVGGAYDAVYMKRITEYAELKYRHRYLAGRKKAENGQLCKRCKSYRDI